MFWLLDYLSHGKTKLSCHVLYETRPSTPPPSTQRFASTTKQFDGINLFNWYYLWINKNHILNVCNIEKCEKCTYVCTMVYSFNDYRNEFKILTEKTRKHFFIMNNVLYSIALSLDERRWFVTCYISTTLVYGAEAWSCRNYWHDRSIWHVDISWAGV